MKREIKLPLTIERQLENYYLCPEHTERHEILWHAWNQNKRWINQLLQMTLASFPTYSKHDESHASSVLHNIEMILGEERIAQLSASDCFVLLHTVYIHDIGMCITYEDREKIVSNRDFLEMVDELEGEGDSSLSEAIEELKRTDYSYHNEEEELVQRQKLYEDKLKVYYALIHLLSNYRRKEHGVRSKEILYKWTLEPDKLGIGFSLSGIPLRIFLSVANSAQLHTNPKFEEILELPQEDDGFALDYYHPRFISVLLQLGDILDMDNNRFHPLTKECMGCLPEISEQHYEKHLSIRRLHIRPDKIAIEADCRTQEALRLVRKECDMLISMLQSAGYYWSVICPPDFIGALPTVETVKLSLEGQRIPEELVTTQFKISQKKAFSLLEGANVYSGRFVFLREFLQNAVDATKMQYWNECCSTKAYYDSPKLWKKANPYDLNKKVSIENFPIEIEMEIQKMDEKNMLSDITDQDIKLLDENRNNYTYGVKVRIKDFGTGIDKDRILNISKVGSSRKSEQILIEKMPEWLRPTAEFGVGLQSVFLLTDSFKCYTHTRSGQRYEITFGSVSTARQEGYINVKPVERFAEKEDTFGTCFEIFVPCSKKFKHQDYFEAWNGEDAFDEYYENRRPLRHSAELLAQMALYLDQQVGELLFPIHLHVKQCKYMECSLNRAEKSKIIHIDLDYKLNDAVKEIQQGENDVKIYIKNSIGNTKREWTCGKTSWIYDKDIYCSQKENGVLTGEIDKLIYLFDCDYGELHVWDGEKNVFASINSKNLICFAKQQSGIKGEKRSVPNGTSVYYKGIILQKRVIEEDSELIEYVDIKGGLEREYINLNRNGFTAEGERFFEEKIYRPILSSVKSILKDIAKKEFEGEIKFVSHVIDNINSKCDELERVQRIIVELESKKLEKVLKEAKESQLSKELEEKKQILKINLEKLEFQIVSIVMLAYLAMREEYVQIGCEDIKKIRCPWEIVVDSIGNVLREHYDIIKLLRMESDFFNLLCCDELCNYQTERKTFVDVFSSENAYAIVQKRESDLRPWKQYLVQLSKGENVLDAICELQFIRNSYEKEQIVKKITSWENAILHNARNIKESFYSQDESKQQFIIKWLQKSVPSIGVFSNEDGNIRVNVLSNKTMPFLYANKEFKMLVLSRILETSKKDMIKRFSTFTWYSNRYLACRNLPYNIYYVKRGYMGEFGLNKTILPIAGSELKKVWEILHKDNIINISEIIQYYNVVNMEGFLRSKYEVSKEVMQNKNLTFDEILLFDFFRKHKEDNNYKRIAEGYTSLVLTTIEKRCVKWDDERWEKIGKKEHIEITKDDIKIWQDLFVKIARTYIIFVTNPNEIDMGYRLAMEKIAEQDGFWKLCELWIYISYNFSCIENSKLFVPEIRNKYFEDLQKNCVVQEKHKRIYKYVAENGYYKLSVETVENCYLNFMNELFVLFQELEVQKIKKLLERIPDRGKETVRVIAQMFKKQNTEENTQDGE